MARCWYTNHVIYDFNLSRVHDLRPWVTFCICWMFPSKCPILSEWPSHGTSAIKTYMEVGNLVISVN
jgi:hypothetical protein